MTGGVAAGDYDGDGLQDLFFTIFHKRSILYKNLGNGKFADVTVETGVGPDKFGNGALWVDIDQDGDLDLYVTTVGDSRHYLYVNYGGVFREEASERGLSMEFPNKRKLSGFTPSFGDFDSDGYPDIYVSEWILHTLDGYPSASKLLHNLGKAMPGFFEDVTDKAGVNMDYFWRTRTKLNAGTHTFGSSFTDFDNDGHQELLITGDYGESKMFWNNGNMTFSECTKPCGLIGDIDAMGHAIGDLNNDGYMEWFSSAIFDNITNCDVSGCMFGNKGNKLYHNLGNRSFAEIADKAGVRVGGWAWGAAFIDFNNDGFLDIVLTNGFDTASTTVDDGFMKQQMILYQNYGNEMGGELKGKMKETSSEHGMNYNGMGRGLLKFDFDNDGDEDVMVATNYGHAVFYENVGGNARNWLRIRVVHRCLEDSAKLCDSFGARVTVTDAKGRNQTQEIGSSTHFLGQSEITAHFGLGNCKQNLTISVVWPATRQTVIIKGVQSRNTLRIVKPRSTRYEVSDFSKFNKCRRLSITDVSLEPGAPFGVEISKDRQSLSLKLHPAIPLNGLGKQRFTYTVKIDSLPSKRSKGIVNIDARVYIRNQTVTSVCPHGRMWLPGMPIATETARRTYNGISNNRKNIHWGAGFENLRRLVPSTYQDEISMPAGTCSKQQMTTKSCPFPHENSGYGSNRPSARFISNELFAQEKPVISERGLSDLHVHYGQFFVHDLDFSSPLPRFEFQHNLNEVWMQISVPKNDTHFDQDGTGDTFLPFTRSIYNRCTGQYPNGYSREQINKISSYIDANHIYGYSESRCRKLRSMKDGKMKLDDDGMIPRNIFGLDNDNSIGRIPSKLRVAGDTRANVAPGLLAFHTLFVLEHNRLCDEYKRRHPAATDEEIFQYARRIIIAEQQAIAFREYVPALLGTSSIPPYKGYNAQVDVSISSVFATAAFRFGHSQVNTHIFRLDEHWDVYKHGHILLRESYFHPERIEHEGGIEPVLRGMIYMPAQKIDTLMVDDLRNALFPVGRFNGLDLAAMNIQRGRDHGLPDFNSVRKFLGLKAYEKFAEISSDTVVTRKLQELYKDINNIDLWVGGLAEDHMFGSELGETFHTIFLEGILRVRDGDRFWYERIMSKEEIEMVNGLTLSKIITLNTGIDNVPDNVFFSAKICKDVVNHNCVKNRRNGQNVAEEHPNTIKYKKAKFAKRFDTKKTSSQEVRSKYNIFKVISVIFGVIILLSIVILGVFLLRRRSSRKAAKPSAFLADGNAGPETDKYVSGNGHDEMIRMLNCKPSQNDQGTKKLAAI